MAKVLVAGDFCPYSRMIGRCDSLEQIAPIVQKADYAIVNLECSILAEKTTGNPICKVGPNLSASPNYLSIIKKAGFSCVTLANNHFADFGQKGVIESITHIKEQHLDYVGGGNNLNEAEQILFKKIGNQTIAFINACENEFTIATGVHGGSNPLNPTKQFYAIQQAKQQADFVLVIIHGGAEENQLPSPRMQETYRFFIDVGANIVINHHQHCYSGYEIYHGKPIFYGLGNFCFDWPNLRDTPWNRGYMVLCDTEKDALSFDIIPYVQCGEEPIVTPLLGEQKDDFFSKIKYLNSIIANKQQLERCYKENVLKTVDELYKVIIPFRMSLWLRKKILCSSRLKPILRRTLNYLRCESHRDRMMIILNQLLQK